MSNFFTKIRSTDGKCPPRAPMHDIAMGWIGGCVAIAIVAILAKSSHTPLVLGSFGASCVLLFGFPESPFSQPRNVICGHLLSSLVGLVFFHLFGYEWWSAGLAAGTAIALMMLTRTVHPPAGSNPVIVMLAASPWSFALTPTLLGAIALVLIALVVNNLPAFRRYPKYWF